MVAKNGTEKRSWGMKKKLPVFGMRIRLCSGFNQVLITSFVCFCCPGFFNALSALGGAGQHDSTSSAAANAALYATFAIFGYLGGAFFALFGGRILMACGGLTYAFYAAAAYISGSYEGYNWLFVLSGAVLGIGASWLWTAQGALMLAYSPLDEDEGTGRVQQRGRGFYIATFWTIFNVGGLLGGFIQFGLNYSETNGNANVGSYCVFIAVMLLGSLTAFFCILDPSRVVKEDGTRVIVPSPKSPREEFSNVASVISDPNMLLLSGLFFGSNFFYTYTFDGINGFMFNLRTRGLNSSMYWAAQMIGAVLIGWIVDNKQWMIGKRALMGFTVVAGSVNIFYALGCYLEYFTLAKFNKNNIFEPLLDFTDTGYFFPCSVFVLYGLGDSMIQAFAYWLMGAIAKDDPALCARYTGFYKGVQSLGAALAWTLDIKQINVPYIYQFWCCWILFIAALPTTFLVVRKISLEESLKHLTSSSNTPNIDNQIPLE